MTSPRHPLTIFCGKGGVGKTTLSLAYALGHASQGRSALVVTSHPLAELAVSVSLAGLKDRSPHAAARLFVLHVDSRELIHHTVRQQIPSRILADAVISSRVYQSLIEVAPGLKEIVFLARLRELAEQRSANDAAKYDVVVWDAPATGHLVQTLQVSRHFNRHLSGPFAAVGDAVSQFFSEPSNVALLPVTTLEEMAVEETIELAAKLRELGMAPRSVVCNMTSPALPWDGEAVFNTLTPERTGQSPSLRLIADRVLAERKLFERVRAEVMAPAKVVERLRRGGSDLDLLLALSQEMERALDSRSGGSS
jgi:anion-transporting  ArsA/GET3 family ATPase